MDDAQKAEMMDRFRALGPERQRRFFISLFEFTGMPTEEVNEVLPRVLKMAPVDPEDYNAAPKDFEGFSAWMDRNGEREQANTD